MAYPKGKKSSDAPKIDADYRATQALNMRLHGATLEQIAARLTFPDGTPMYPNAKAVWDSLDRLVTKMAVESVETLRKVEGARLDRLQLAYWQLAIGTPDEPMYDRDGNDVIDKVTGKQKIKKGQPPDAVAAGVILRIMARRAKLYGLDAPIEVKTTGLEGGEAPPKLESSAAAMSQMSDDDLAAFRRALQSIATARTGRPDLAQPSAN